MRGPYHKTEKPVTRRITWIESYLCEGTYDGNAEDLKERAFIGSLKADDRKRLRNTKVEVTVVDKNPEH